MSTIDTNNPDYENLVKLLAILSEATARQTALEAQFNQEYLDAIDGHLAEYAANQKALSDAEAAIVLIAERNPGWFIKPRTVTTPYGSVKSTSSRKLDAPSESASIRLIKAAGREAEFVRVVEELDREALEKLTDDELAEFGILRKPTETVKVTPATVDLGEAVKAAADAAQIKAA